MTPRFDGYGVRIFGDVRVDNRVRYMVPQDIARSLAQVADADYVMFIVSEYGIEVGQSRQQFHSLARVQLIVHDRSGREVYVQSQSCVAMSYEQNWMFGAGVAEEALELWAKAAAAALVMLLEPQ